MKRASTGPPPIWKPPANNQRVACEGQQPATTVLGKRRPPGGHNLIEPDCSRTALAVNNVARRGRCARYSRCFKGLRFRFYQLPLRLPSRRGLPDLMQWAVSRSDRSQESRRLIRFTLAPLVACCPAAGGLQLLGENVPSWNRYFGPGQFSKCC